MKRLDKNILISCLKLMLKPVVGFCFRHALRLQDVIDALKVVFVEHAQREMQGKGVKANISRVSLMSGVHRRDVHRFMRLPASTSPGEPKDLLTKIMGQWQTDKRYITKAGKPRVLSIGAENCEFFELVREVTTDLNPATVLFELERCGAIQCVRGGAKLILESYVPIGDVEGGFKILASDMDDLTQGVEENTLTTPEIHNLHARTTYDAIRTDALPELKRWFLREGHALHTKAREFISQFDQDINPDTTYKGPKAKVILGAFSKTSIEEEKKKK